MATLATQHGPYVAGYDNCAHLLYGGDRPFIECLCGWRSGRGHQCWMTAGEEFDEHLESGKGE